MDAHLYEIEDNNCDKDVKIENISSTQDEISFYMSLIGSTSVLSAEEEQKYFKEYKENPTPELKEFLFKKNARLVVAIAKKYSGNIKNMTMMDLISEGNLGLLKALDLFEVDKGYKFSTYATWWIRQSITRAIADEENIIRIPVHMHEKLGAIRRYIAAEMAKNGNVPKEKEIAKALKMKLSEVEKALEYFTLYSVTSINIPVGESEHGDVTEIGDFIPDERDVEKEAERNELVRVVNQLLDDYIDSKLHYNLDDVRKEKVHRKKEMLAKRLGLLGYDVHTLDEVGKEYGVTRERVRQIEADFIKYLRHPARRRKLEEFAN